MTACSSVLLSFLRHCFFTVYSFGGRPLFGWSLFLLLLAVELQLRRLYTHGCLHMHQLTSALHQPSSPPLPPELSSDCTYLWALTFGGLLVAGLSFIHHILSALMGVFRSSSPATDIHSADLTHKLGMLFGYSHISTEALSPPSASTAATAKAENLRETSKCSVDWWQDKKGNNAQSHFDGSKPCGGIHMQKEREEIRQSSLSSLSGDITVEEKVTRQYSHVSKDTREEPQSFYIGDSDENM
eukprot:GHVS01087265.1.p1 GENE.GHVS01087265.1~~GHVS01087265.1.p1  ORF type:complete len:251 (-),score=45.80 GHVS01087265.1:38-763(-)